MGRTLRDLAALRPRSARLRSLLAALAPAVVVIAVAALDLVLSPEHLVLPLLVPAPLMAAFGAPRPRRILWLGTLTLIVAAFVGFIHPNAPPAAVLTTLIGVASVTLMGGRSAIFLERQTRTLVDVRAVAETVQRVVLQPIPRQVGPLRAEVRYLAAAAEARVGGDLYAMLNTQFGVRLLIGDVVGHGLPAVQTAAEVLSGFRELARHEPKLLGIALRLNMALARREDGSGFVTALLVNIPNGDAPAEVVCCGHPPPLLLRGSQVTFLDLVPPSPPLGLLHLRNGGGATSTVPFGPGDRLLFYTDGVTEARDGEGRFYPLAERAVALRRDDPAAFLDALEGDLLRHTGGQLHSAGRLEDDAALLLVERIGTGAAATSSAGRLRVDREPSEDRVPAQLAELPGAARP